MPYVKLLLSAILLLAWAFDACLCFEAELTVYVEPGKKECFHQHISKDTKFEVEYQVIEGGDLDLNFVISSPSGRVLVSKIRATEAMHRETTKEEGDYKFCLDNSFSRFSKKMVFFELLTDDEEEEAAIPDLPTDESIYEMKLEDIKDGLALVRRDLDKSREILRVMKAIESRDRSIQESNFIRVNFWSGVQLAVMVSVGLVQVLMIRGLFEEKSTGGRSHLNMKT